VHLIRRHNFFFIHKEQPEADGKTFQSILEYCPSHLAWVLQRVGREPSQISDLTHTFPKQISLFLWRGFLFKPVQEAKLSNSMCKTNKQTIYWNGRGTDKQKVN